MKMQIITQNSLKISDNVKINTFKNLESLDIYDVNIFDLRNLFWCNKGDSKTSINLIADIKHIENLINTAKNKNNIIVMPQNSKFQYYHDYEFKDGVRNYKYRKSEDLKNCFEIILKIITNNFVFLRSELGYEKNVTNLNGISYNSDFYFIPNERSNEKVITSSFKSNKITSIITDKDMVLTTLDILSNNVLENYLCYIGMSEDKIKAPIWIEEIEILDDDKLKKEKNKKEIDVANMKREIDDINTNLSKNDNYKSILYETGTKLNIVVNNILSEIFDIKPEKFNDVYEEDFLLKLDDITFVIEVKGIIHNVSGKNVSDAFNHVQVYLDDIEAKNLKEKVKGILIVANQREINPKAREPINERQVNIARRNELLIVTTEDILNLYQKYVKKEISSIKIKEIFDDNIGLLELKEV